jgi:hypothetical protein
MSRKKQLYKIRLRPDGQWEHVYDDGSTDMEFHQLDPAGLADIAKKRREEKLFAYHCLSMLHDQFIEEAIEKSDWIEAKLVLNHIMKK